MSAIIQQPRALGTLLFSWFFSIIYAEISKIPQLQFRMELWPSEQESPFFETPCIFDICFEESRAEVPPPFAIALLRSWGNATTLLKLNIYAIYAYVDITI